MAVAPRSNEGVRSDRLDNMIHFRWIDSEMSKRKRLPVVIRTTGAGRLLVFLLRKKGLQLEVLQGNLSQKVDRFPFPMGRHGCRAD